MEPDEKPTPEPDLIAQMDQVYAHVRDLAQGMIVYYKVLVDGGMDAQSALMMTVSYQQAVIQKGGENG